MNRLLFIESGNTNSTSELLASGVIAQGYQAARIRLDTLEGIDTAATILGDTFKGQPPTLILLDLSSVSDVLLPLRHLQRLLRQVWGEDGGSLPIIALLAQSHLMQRGWQAFVADFALAPYGTNELLTRIQMLFFRRQQSDGSLQTVFEDVVLDFSSRRAVTQKGQSIPLTPREYDLLQFLLTHRGKLFGRERLLDLVWGVNYEGGTRTVDIHIRRLRAKLPPLSAALLETRRGVGYGFLQMSPETAVPSRSVSARDRA